MLKKIHHHLLTYKLYNFFWNMLLIFDFRRNPSDLTPLQIKKYLNKKASTIAKREYKVGICIDGIECLLEYDEYRKECLRTGIHYNTAWKNNQVYNKSVLIENYLSETV